MQGRINMKTLTTMSITLCCCAALAEGSKSRSSIGAIRCDMWPGGGVWEQNMAPKQWHSRLPFYAKILAEDKIEVCDKSQDVRDQEILYASNAGIDYWAFCLDNSTDYGWRQYLTSTYKSKINFCFVASWWWPTSHRNSPKSLREEWYETIDLMVSLFKEPTHQTTPDGRPLLYIFLYKPFEEDAEVFGSVAEMRKAMDAVKEKAVAAGLKPPFIAAQTWDPAFGAKWVDEMGYDAISAYVNTGGSEDREYPYGSIAESNRKFWEDCKATGKQVIPNVTIGWDTRPRRTMATYEQMYKSKGGPWFVQPTPQEIADNLAAALDWNKHNAAQATADSIIMYAWNELDEGGWLVPSLSEGTARLDAIRKILR
jgi:hypothetical protein